MAGTYLPTQSKGSRKGLFPLPPIFHFQTGVRFLPAHSQPDVLLHSVPTPRIQKVDSADWFAVLRWLNQGQNLTTLRDYEPRGAKGVSPESCVVRGRRRSLEQRRWSEVVK